MVTIAAGRLPQPQESLAAMSIFQQTNALSFMLPLGLSIATGIRWACLLFPNSSPLDSPVIAMHCLSKPCRSSAKRSMPLGRSLFWWRSCAWLYFLMAFSCLCGPGFLSFLGLNGIAEHIHIGWLPGAAPAAMSMWRQTNCISSIMHLIMSAGRKLLNFSITCL